MFLPRRQHPSNIQIPDIDRWGNFLSCFHTVGKNFQCGLRVGTEKEGNGISSFLFVPGFVADAMDGCGEEGVGLVFEVLKREKEEGEED